MVLRLFPEPDFVYSLDEQKLKSIENILFIKLIKITNPILLIYMEI